MNEERLRKVLLGLGVAFSLFFCLAPFVYMVWIGLAGQPDFLRPDVPTELTLRHFRGVFAAPSIYFLSSLRNSLIVSAASAIMAVFLASLAAYGLVRFRLPGKRFLLLFILGVSLFPAVSLVSPIFQIMARLGWINTYPALIFPYVAWNVPLAVWILVSYFSQVPEELDQAGLIDGCSRFQVLVRIVYPVAAPGLFATALLIFIFAFSEFLLALMLTTDHSARTIPVAIALFEGLHGETPWGEIMAAATLTTLPVVILAFLFQRKIIHGLTRGAVKE
jgi:trehalose/maltose transport system permease protein